MTSALEITNSLPTWSHVESKNWKFVLADSDLFSRSYYDNEDFYLNLLDEEMGTFDEDQYLERLKRIG